MDGIIIRDRGPETDSPRLHMVMAVLSAKFITGGYAGIDRRMCINSEGGHSAPEAIEFKVKTGWV